MRGGSLHSQSGNCKVGSVKRPDTCTKHKRHAHQDKYFYFDQRTAVSDQDEMSRHDIFTQPKHVTSRHDIFTQPNTCFEVALVTFDCSCLSIDSRRIIITKGLCHMCILPTYSISYDFIRPEGITNKNKQKHQHQRHKQIGSLCFCASVRPVLGSVSCVCLFVLQFLLL